MSSLLGPRTLPIAPRAAEGHRHLPLAGPSRDRDRKWKPTYCVWEITLRCDLACRHCGSRAGRARPDELSTEQCLDLVDQMADLGVMEVTLIGGEAYLRDDWVEIGERVRARGMMLGITTGGRGMTKERARAAKRAGVQSISVSLDGLERSHDAQRGVEGSFRAAIEAIAHVREAGIAVSMNTQVNRMSLPELPALLALVVPMKIHSWQVQITAAMGRAADEPELLLQPYQVLELLPLLARLRREVLVPNGVRLWPGNNIGYFGPHEDELRGGLPRGHMSSCGAGRSTLGIEANGDIKGCPSLPSAEYVGGNIRDHSLREIWEQTTPLRLTRDRTVEDLWGYCRTCYYADECRAGCNWTSHVLLGKPGNNPYCHHRSLELLREGKRERIVRVEEAPGMPFDNGRYEIVLENWPAEELEQARKLAEIGVGVSTVSDSI